MTCLMQHIVAVAGMIIQAGRWGMKGWGNCVVKLSPKTSALFLLFFSTDAGHGSDHDGP